MSAYGDAANGAPFPEWADAPPGERDALAFSIDFVYSYTTMKRPGFWRRQWYRLLNAWDDWRDTDQRIHFPGHPRP